MDSRICLLLLAATASAVLAADKIPISIYFESLCPDSKSFIVQQFTKAYGKAKNDIEPDFVPFGHANITDGKNYCQHGDYECDGNKILGCAINLMKTKTDDLVSFVNCIMALENRNLSGLERNSTISFPVDKCQKEAGTFYEKITQCANSTEGQKYFEDFGNKTKTIFGNRTFGVPYVIYNNGGLNDDLSQNFTKDFLKTLCDPNVNGNKTLASCQKSSASSLAGSLLLGVIAVFIARL